MWALGVFCTKMWRQDKALAMSLTMTYAMQLIVYDKSCQVSFINFLIFPAIRVLNSKDCFIVCLFVVYLSGTVGLLKSEIYFINEIIMTQNRVPCQKKHESLGVQDRDEPFLISCSEVHCVPVRAFSIKMWFTLLHKTSHPLFSRISLRPRF